MSSGKVILRNVFSNWFGLGFQMLIALFIAPFLVHRLGDAGYGIWIMIMSFVGYFGLVDLGVRTSIVKYCAQFEAGGEDRKFNEIVNSTLAFYLCVGTAVFLSCLVLSAYFPDFFITDQSYHRVARWVVIILGINLGVGFPFEVFGGILSGLQRYDLANMAKVLAAALKNTAIVIFLLNGYGLLALSLITLFSNIGFSLMETALVYREYPRLRLGWRFVKLSALRQAFSYSIFSFIMAVSTRITFHTGALIIGAFMSEKSVTFFAIGANLIEYLRRLLNAMVYVFTPAVSASEAKGDQARVGNILVRGARYGMFIIMPIGLILMIMGKAFIGVWMGEEYVQLSGTVLMILMSSHFLSLSQFPSRAICFGLGKHRIPAFIACLNALISLGLCLVLVQKYGVIGVAVGTALPLFILLGIFYLIYTCRIMNLSVWTYCREVYTAPILTSIPFGLLLYLFRVIHFPKNWLTLLSEIGMAILVYIGLVWILGLGREEKTAWLNMIQSARSKFRGERH